MLRHRVSRGFAFIEVLIAACLIMIMACILLPTSKSNFRDLAVSAQKDEPTTTTAPSDFVELLTPAPPASPRINGPRVVGCRPGHPFIFRIPTTGQRPMTFAADHLPPGLMLDSASGIITGSCATAGEWIASLTATNSRGQATGRLRIACGDTLALTPPMGFNDWYAFYDRVTDETMRHAAEILVSSGMADVGYQYVNIDDCWAFAPSNRDKDRVGPLRDEKGNILPNRHFPDMKGLTDYIHVRGLRAGIYTSPGPLTCARFTGSWQHEAQDARQFADWGFDFLKYDWCSYSRVLNHKPTLEELKRPYALMGRLLRQQPRDIVFNLCQYGMGNVWEWGGDVDGNSWRTADDLGLAGLSKIFDIALTSTNLRAYARPGQWNDPDYIQIGLIGSARQMGKPHPAPLTATEEYAFMSLWCLSASPLFYSGDIEHLDPLTINVLTNPEVINVDQDPLGQPARVVQITDKSFILIKNMEDGSKAIGFANRGTIPITLSADWPTLGLNGKQTARDLWRQKDLGTSEGQFLAEVPPHGVLLLQLRPAN
ncbi:MAG: putative Ig domain-containing protein [Planctomycetota bacterium]|nr:putative Ig domain-containing protein [Planctomycetota bacterium]